MTNIYDGSKRPHPGHVFGTKTVTSRSEAEAGGYPLVYPTFRLVLWCPYCHEQHVHGHDDSRFGGFRLSHCRGDKADRADWYYIATDYTAYSNIGSHVRLPQGAPQEP